MDTPLVIRGRRITDNDIVSIRSIIERYWAQGRTFISREICHLWDWRQPNGSLKEMACRELLLRLERKGLLNLPPRRNGWKGKGQKRPFHIPLHSTETISTPLSKLSPIEIKMVRHTEWEPLYNGLIERYHYLGYCQTVGEHLKYIAFYKDRPQGYIGWGAGAWKVSSRDDFIGWSTTHRLRNIHLIAQNTRLLILPWVQVPYLASHILGRMAKILPEDWERVYNHTIVLLETFVDTERFKGTCYKASNWIQVGLTKGRGKWDTHNRASAPIKAVFLYPLIKDFRRVLTHYD